MKAKIINIYCTAIILGGLVGMVGSLFILSINSLSYQLEKGYVWLQIQGFPTGLMSAIVSMIFVLIAWLLVQMVAPEAAGSGIPEIEGKLTGQLGLNWRRLLPIKFIGGILAISAKLVVGREGPTVQIGGNLGGMVAEFLRLPEHRANALIAAGAAAGLATAFNAPVAGIVFVLEEMRGKFHFTFTNYSVVTICTIVAVIMLHFMVGPQLSLPMPIYSAPSNEYLHLFVLFGFIVGLVGLFYNLVLIKWLLVLHQLNRHKKALYVALITLPIGYLAWTMPQLVGGGYNIINQSLTMQPSFQVLLTLILVRFGLSLFSYSTGVPGGIFAPILALGTLLGLAASHLFQGLVTEVNPGIFAVAGMGALFAAVVRAPLTGIILVIEMTGNYSLIMPLMLSCMAATTILQLAGNPPIYTQLLYLSLNKKAMVSKDFGMDE